MPSQPESLIKLSIQDFFTKDILKLAILPFIATMVVMYTLFFIAADYGLDQLTETQVHIQQSETTLNPDGTTHTEHLSQIFSGSAIMAFLLKYSITSWLVSFLIYTVGSFIVMYISVLVALFIIGFLTPWILPIIRDRHYKEITMQGFGTIPEVIWFFVKTVLIMLAIFFVLIPFYFIPLLNIIAFNLPFYYLFHRLLNFDVGSTICSKEDYRQIMFYRGNGIRLRTFVMYLLTLVPFVAIFTMVYFVVYLGHFYFNELRKMNAVTTSNASIEATSSAPQIP